MSVNEVRDVYMRSRDGGDIGGSSQQHVHLRPQAAHFDAHYGGLLAAAPTPHRRTLSTGSSRRKKVLHVKCLQQEGHVQFHTCIVSGELALVSCSFTSNKSARFRVTGLACMLRGSSPFVSSTASTPPSACSANIDATLKLGSTVTSSHMVTCRPSTCFVASLSALITWCCGWHASDQ
jgi:hypothetical protein